MRRLPAAIVRFRFAIVAAWVAMAVALYLALPTIEEAQVGSLGDLLPDEGEAIDAEERAAELFTVPTLSRVSIVVGSETGLDERTRREVLERLAALNTEPEPGLESVIGAVPVSNGDRPFGFRVEPTAVIAYLFIAPGIGQVGSTGLAERVADRIEAEHPETEALVTGPVPARAARGEVIRDRLPLVELLTVAMVVVALGLYFRALAVPILAIVGVAVAYVVSIRVVAWAGQQLEISAPRELEPVIVALLFGIVTDYVVFLVSRFRAELAGAADPRRATLVAVARLGPVILTAGLIIAGASSALLVADLGFLRAFGPGMALTALVGALVAITFVPALFAIVGRRLLWPRGAPSDDADNGGGTIAARLVADHPLPAAAGAVVLLVAAATGIARLDVGDPQLESLPASNEVRRGYERASREFAAGIVSPVMIVIEGPGIERGNRALERIEREIDEEPAVSSVVGPADLPEAPPGGLVSEHADAARYFAILSTDPLGGVAIDRVRRLRRRMPALLTAAGLPDATALVGGDTALIAETVSRTRSSLTEVAPVALLVVLCLLALLLRALVAPLVLVAASVLALLAALGGTVYLFQGLLGYPELTFFVPFAAAVLLLALGSDYNVFLARRIWDEARRRPFREAVGVATARASAPIAAAGMILALSFAALAVIPIRSFQELAFAMAFGLLLDAFVVRTLLVPSLLSLIGPRAAWPSRPQ